MNHTEQFRLASYYKLRSHRRWEKGPLCLTKAVYVDKVVYTFVLYIGRMDLQFSLHWMT